jgi:hypothetical protein
MDAEWHCEFEPFNLFLGKRDLVDLSVLQFSQGVLFHEQSSDNSKSGLNRTIRFDGVIC